MALIKWNESFSVGNDAIDREHEHLIEQINQLSDWFVHHFTSFDARLHHQLGS